MATIQGVYVALFGRPADPTGLAYFNGVTNNGANLSAINNLAGQKEYTDRFAGQNNVQIVNSIYQSLFGRDAEAGGLNFFVDALNKGTLNINNIAIAILDGAQGSDKTTVDAKLAAANLFTAALDTPAEVGSYVGNGAAASARTWLAGITTAAQATQASADAIVAKIVTDGAAGNTITAAAAIVTLDGTTGIGAAGSEKTTTNLNDTINAGTFWAPSTSKIDGGLGTDTLNATVNALAAGGTGTVVADGLKNVEVLNVTTVTAASTLEVQNAKQLAQLWHVGSATSVDLVATGLSLSATLGVKGNFAATAATTTASFTDALVTSTAKVALDAVSGAGAITINSVGTVDLSNTGSSTATIAGTTITTLNVSGSGSLSLTSPANIETVAASSFTGALTADFTANGALKSVVSGSGNDKITIDTTHANDITINAGAGNDTITVNADVGNPTKALSLTGGEGADIFVLGGTAAGLDNVGAKAGANYTDAEINGTLVTIADFNKAQDAIKVQDGAGNLGRDVLLDAELSAISGAGSLAAAATLAGTYTDIGKVSVFAFGADAYVYVNTAGAGLDAGDGLVKVVGATVADLTAANFQII